MLVRIHDAGQSCDVEVLASVHGPQVPGQPQITEAQSGDGEVTVSWTAPVDDGGSPLLSYTVTAQPGGRTCTVDAPNTSCIVTGLINGTEYTFTVAATNAVGTGEGSLPSDPVVPDGDLISVEIILSNLYQVSGSQGAVGVTTNPVGIATRITYNGSATLPTAAGTYRVDATVTQAGHRGHAMGLLVIVAGQPTPGQPVIIPLTPEPGDPSDPDTPGKPGPEIKIGLPFDIPPGFPKGTDSPGSDDEIMEIVIEPTWPDVEEGDGEEDTTVRSPDPETVIEIKEDGTIVITPTLPGEEDGRPDVEVTVTPEIVTEIVVTYDDDDGNPVERTIKSSGPGSDVEISGPGSDVEIKEDGTVIITEQGDGGKIVTTTVSPGPPVGKIDVTVTDGDDEITRTFTATPEHGAVFIWEPNGPPSDGTGELHFDLNDPFTSVDVTFSPHGCGEWDVAAMLVRIHDAGQSCDVEVLADVPTEKFRLTVTGGTGGGEYQAGDVVGISANIPAEGQVFAGWTGDVANVTNVNNPNTTVRMPEADVSVTATYRDLPTQRFTLTVSSGTGSGAYEAGQVARIAADVPAEDQLFDRWTGDVGHLANVRNPNTTVTMPDADISVTATYRTRPETLYTLSVGSGTGTGEYAAGRVVAVSANPPAAGRVFSTWSGDVEHLENLNNPNTTLRMPDANVSVTTLYRAIPVERFALTVGSGSGSGEYLAGQEVALAANPAEDGLIFDVWTGQTSGMANVHTPNTTLTMPASSVQVRATYKTAPTERFPLTVTSGTGTGAYPAGRVVNLSADPAPEDWMFDAWTGQTSGLANVNNPNTTVTMPASAVTVRATYRERPVETFALNVGAGTGSGGYRAGTVVDIAANEAPEGKVFQRWTGQTSFLTNPSDPNTTLTMPASSVSVTAGYMDRPTQRFQLFVSSGTGSGAYAAGQVASIAAEPAADGLVFDKWIGQTGTVANVNLPNTILTMPASDVRIRATYKADPGITEPKELRVNHGTGGGMYLPGRVVSIAAEVREGFLFDKWVGQTYALANVNIPNTTINMPDAKVVITATFKPGTEELFRLRQRVFVPAPPQTRQSAAAQAFLRANAVPVEVTTPAGRIVRLSAPAAPDGYAFDKWIGQTANVDNIHLAQTYVYMPDTDVDVTASYAALPETATLVVEGGSGSGDSVPGTVVAIQANAPAEGMMFDKWEGQTAQVANVNLARTSLTMPGTDVRIRAVYRELPEGLHTLTVQGGDGDGDYAAASLQNIVSGEAPPDQIFARWIGQVANLEDINAEQTTVYMPPHDVEVVATYASYFTATPEVRAGGLHPGGEGIHPDGEGRPQDSTASTSGGRIEPGEPQQVIEGERTEFRIIPDDGNQAIIESTCGGSRSGELFITNPLTQDCTITASFVQAFHSVTPLLETGLESQTSGGSISPYRPQLVARGSSVEFTLTPDPGMTPLVDGNCDGILTGDVYVVDPVIRDCTFTVRFTAITAIPTLSEWGLIILSAVFLVLGFGLFRHRQTRLMF